MALKSDAAAEKPKDQLSRDFLGCSIFDFCNKQEPGGDPTELIGQCNSRFSQVSKSDGAKANWTTFGDMLRDISENSRKS